MVSSVATVLKARDKNGPAAWLYLTALLPPAFLFAAAALQPYVDPSELFRDPLAVADNAAENGECCHAHYGLLSLLGGLLWAGSAFVTAFAAMLLQKRKNIAGAWQFMAAASILTLIFVVDDMFQGHEIIYPKLFGIPEEITFTVYALLVAAYLLTYKRHIFAAGPGLLIISLLFFAIGVASDMFVSADLAWHRLVEDGSKLVGIFCWTAFHCWAACRLVDRS